MPSIKLSPLPKYSLGQEVHVTLSVDVKGEIFEKGATGYIKSIYLASDSEKHIYVYHIWPILDQPYLSGQSFTTHPEPFKEEEITSVISK